MVTSGCYVMGGYCDFNDREYLCMYTDLTTERGGIPIHQVVGCSTSVVAWNMVDELTRSEVTLSQLRVEASNTVFGG